MQTVLDLALSDEQLQLREFVAGFLARECPPDRVRASEPLGHDEGLWKQAVSLGLPAIAVPADAGGEGGGLLDAAVVAEELGARVAPVPVVEALIAGRLLARLGCVEVADMLGGAPAALALRAEEPDQLVPAGAVAELAIALRRGELLLGRVEPPQSAPANTACSPLATVDMSGATAIAAEEVAVAAHERAVDEWRLLVAAQLVGMARQSLALARDYALTRQQFGVPIGAFQTLAHRLADDATAIDGARLLVHKAAWAADEDRRDAPALASMALSFATRTAVAATGNSLHVHGGYGFMLEYDIQLYYRRAKAYPLLLGDPRRELDHLAALLWDQHP
jgi:alkylation response protein AidB-like acyl-CoA dehydrogenase